MKKLIFLLLAIPMCCQAQLLFSANWDAGTLAQGKFQLSKFGNKPWDAQLVTTADRSGGNKAVRIELRYTDTVVGFSKRSEFWILKTDSVNTQGRWFGVSDSVAPDYASDVNPENFFQLHGDNSNPPLWELWLEKDIVYLHQTFDPEGDGTNASLFNISVPYKKGKWNDWLVHYVPSTGPGGLIELYLNGQLVKSVAGPNFNAGEWFRYIQTGIYKWRWNTLLPTPAVSTRVRFVDRFFIYGGATTLADIIGPASPTPPPPAPVQPVITFPGRVN